MIARVSAGEIVTANQQIKIVHRTHARVAVHEGHQRGPLQQHHVDVVTMEFVDHPLEFAPQGQIARHRREVGGLQLIAHAHSERRLRHR